MTAQVSIVEATRADLHEMITLRCDAAEEDILTRFLYGHRHEEASRNEAHSLTISLGKRFTRPTNRCHIVKAIDSQTGELMGWGLVRWEDGKWVYGASPANNESNPISFATYYSQQVRENWLAILAGEPHVVIGALNVRVDRQRRGIGRRIIEYMYSKYQLDGELVIVQTRGSAEHFYAKLGWTTVGCTDIDLSKWAGDGLGFGMHRSPQMLRGPRPSGVMSNSGASC